VKIGAILRTLARLVNRGSSRRLIRNATPEEMREANPPQGLIWPRYTWPWFTIESGKKI